MKNTTMYGLKSVRKALIKIKKTKDAASDLLLLFFSVRILYESPKKISASPAVTASGSTHIRCMKKLGKSA